MFKVIKVLNTPAFTSPDSQYTMIDIPVGTTLMTTGRLSDNTGYNADCNITEGMFEGSYTKIPLYDEYLDAKMGGPYIEAYSPARVSRGGRRKTRRHGRKRRAQSRRR